ncbi:hypothetical protein ILUMI_23986 [Ignelater luminosus]|uniref:Uncharacterized protein n=1 Tax=Ignelater luminosus TaxID=2038154 RepID=A0A8K0C734_IGNLU|nr:hypothetical protein ILUMI_23986 [Ignelater luminosus]
MQWYINDPSITHRRNRRKATKRKIKSSELKIEDKLNEYQKKIKEKSTQVQDSYTRVSRRSMSYYETWEKINKKMTRWWNEEVKEEIKLNKRKWKEYRENETQDSYHNYKEQRQEVRRIVQDAKKASWEQLRDEMEKRFCKNPKLFYRRPKKFPKSAFEEYIRQK